VAAQSKVMLLSHLVNENAGSNTTESMGMSHMFECSNGCEGTNIPPEEINWVCV